MNLNDPRSPVCFRCSEPAVIYQRNTGHHLCGVHLAEDIESRVADGIKTHRMIIPGDRVAVALSGGKDSTALLLLLVSLLPAWERVKLIAVTIDEGIAGYREATIRAAEQLACHLGVEHHCISFPDLYGDSLDVFLEGRVAQACSICGILRRKALVVGARQAGATKLATGHNLDDEAQSVLMNIFRGDLPRLIRNSGADSSGKFIPRIKPLSRIQEKEIAVYLMLKNAWNELPECPYTRYALRREVRSILSNFEDKHPGTMLHLMESREKIEHSCVCRAIPPLRHCRACGDPSSGDLCQVCSLLQSSGR